ncbi:hypothetical protein, partial [Pseudomonas capsici]|uniref:hypothetical protein n=1 Tax=Pseudomonas capsici TaxID=2810614 RepID=UPI0021F1A472
LARRPASQPTTQYLHSAFPYVAIGGAWAISVQKAKAKAKAEKLFATTVRTPQNATLVKAKWRHGSGAAGELPQHYQRCTRDTTTLNEDRASQAVNECEARL